MTVRREGSCCHILKCMFMCVWPCLLLESEGKSHTQLNLGWGNVESTPKRRWSSGVLWEGRMVLRMEMYRLFEEAENIPK